VDHLALLLFEYFLFGTDVDDVLDIVFGYEGSVRRRRDTEEPDDRIGKQQKRRVDRRHDPGEPFDDGRQAQRPAFVIRDRDRLRNDLAEGEQQHRHRRRRHDGRLRHAGLHEQQGRERVRREQNDRVADQDRREEAVAVVEQPYDGIRALEAAFDHPARAQARERNKGRLGARKERRGKNQHDKCRDLGEVVTERIGRHREAPGEGRAPGGGSLLKLPPL
jgi:hypothetical protein